MIKRRLYTLFIIFLIIPFTMYAQILETNSLSDITKIHLFKYITGIEENSDYIFFFKKSWIDSIEIQVVDTNTFSIDVLCKKLNENNLNIYLDNKNVFIYPGKKLVTEIPDYKTKNINEKFSYQENNGLADAERNYIQSKKIASVEVLSVGNKNNRKNDQTCMVSGNIRDEETGEALIGATIYVEELEIGVATNVDGEFKLAIKPGKYKILVNHISMKQKEYFLQVYSSGRLTIEMRKGLIEIDEVVITPDHYNHVKGMQMGFERITTKTMKEIPMVMGEKDIIKVAQMLPGVENVGEGSSGFNVRGSSTDQNMFYINKIPVYNTSHLFGFFTSFSPDIIKDFTLYKGNIPAKFGGRLASVFDISIRQGNKKKFFGQGGISPVTSHFSFEGPIQKNKTSVVTSWRSSYSDWILKRIGNFNNIKNSNAFFYDATLGINTEIDDNNRLKVFGYKSFDRFNISGSNKYEYSNTGGSVVWKHQFPKSLTSDISYVYSNYLFNNIEMKNPSDAHSNKYSIEQHEIKGDFIYTSLNNHNLCFGASGILYKINRGELLPYSDESNWIPVLLGTENGMEGGLYISDEFRLLPRLSLLAGLRYSFFMSLGPKEVNVYFEDSPKNKYNIKDTKMFDKGQVSKYYSSPELRAALNYSLGDNSSVKASYNHLSQYIFMLSNTIAISPNDQWKLVDYNIRPPVSDQISAGIYNDFFNNSVQASLEIYRKWINNIIEYKDGADFISPDPVEMQILQGIQNTKGIEFILKKKSGKLTGWLSYAYSRSFISVNGPTYEEKINNGKSYPSNYHRPHSVNLVLNHRLSRRFSYSVNFVYTTGRPITYPISKYYSEGQELLYYSERNKYRIPDYIRLDFSINFEGNLFSKKLAHGFWMFNVYNLLGRKNAYSVFYEVEDNELQGYRLSIFARPILTLSWNFKFGNYLSE
jgi:hypothetical protein